MRLTLRTLLAYLDDVLDPATLKELGVRVSESAPAAATVARIKEVVRRRRIAAPELTGSGSAPDPNIVAEYLDNTLDPAAVPALEKLCLDSDMHLAEVASSHQILTAVLGEPVDVPMSTRERMYALVSQAPLAVAPLSEAESGVAGPLPNTTREASAKPVLRPMTPDYLKPAAGRNLVFGVLATCLFLGWVGWVLKDQGMLPIFKSSTVTVAAAPQDEQEAALGDPAPEPEPEPATADPLVAIDESSLAVATPLTAPEMDDETGTSLISNGAENQDRPAESVPPMPEPAVPNADTPEKVGLANPSVPEPPVPAEPALQPFPAMEYSNAEGILLRRDRNSGQWNVMPRRALVHPGDEIATPDPFQSAFTVNNTTLEITLFGGARVRLAPGVGADVLTMEIDRGRVAFRRPLAGEHQEPISIGLKLRGQMADLTLNEPGCQCGVEVGQRPPQGRRPDPLLLLPEGGVHVISGSVSLAWNRGVAETIGADVGWAGWPVPPNPLRVGPLRAIPSWLAPEGAPQTAADKKWIQTYEKEFAINQPVSMSIPALVSDRRENISALATYTLGLVDEVPMLVKALQSEHEKTRQAAIWTLRGWLPSGPNNTKLLSQEVGRIFPDEDVADVVALLWGYSREDARDPVISSQLVELMDHKEIAIRELAFFDASYLTTRTNAHGYRPNLADSPRNAALNGWRNMLEKNGGTLLK